MVYRILFLGIGILTCTAFVRAKNIYVGPEKPITRIQEALKTAQDGDTIWVEKAYYAEGNLLIDKRIALIGINYPVLDGKFDYEIISVTAPGVYISGLALINSGRKTMSDPAALKVYDADSIHIENNYFANNFFGIYLQYSEHSIVKNNYLIATQKEEYQSGNGIHCWKSKNLQIIGNKIEGHRDGIYFEFVTESIIWRNIAKNNMRYGLHFMFSHDDAYIGNYFENNGAGVAVMFTRNVTMINNTFKENRGDAAYGILLKELSQCYLAGNTFIKNTTGIFLDGSNRITAENNRFMSNGWGMRMQANCMDNIIRNNDFLGNTFDVSTNGTLTLNTFTENYWDKYEGYDLNKDKIGDIPYHPLSLFAVIVEKNPPAMLLYRSFMISLLDKSEKIIPSLTPQNFVDNNPKMQPNIR